MATIGYEGSERQMRYRPMGDTGVMVSEIGFGTGDNAGLLVRGTPQDQHRTFERALELGINYWDTSPDYGDHVGLAETNIGKLMKEFQVRPIITTKVEVMPNDLDDVAGAVERSLENSLKRLDTDWVDVLQIHNPPALETDTTVSGWIHLGMKDYLALVHGTMAEDEGLVDAPIGRHARERQKMAVVAGGRASRTGFTVLERFGDFTLLEAHLLTGRTHQIRVHFASIGHPVAGDDTYGPARRPPGLRRQFLHAARLRIVSPHDQQARTFTSDLPDDLARVLDLLRRRGRRG